MSILFHCKIKQSLRKWGDFSFTYANNLVYTSLCSISTFDRTLSPRSPLCYTGLGLKPLHQVNAPGFCKAAKLDEITRHGYVLTPGRYVGAAAVEEDDEPFEEKMQRLPTARVSVRRERTTDERYPREFGAGELWRVN